jgi:hypothetical protein
MPRPYETGNRIRQMGCTHVPVNAYEKRLTATDVSLSQPRSIAIWEFLKRGSGNNPFAKGFSTGGSFAEKWLPSSVSGPLEG